jgi:ABC-type transporter Mla maintaining outer membrane lipid asymmetry ATPase subunit MlaF
MNQSIRPLGEKGRRESARLGGDSLDEAARSSPSPLEVHDLTVAYHKRPVLYGIDLTVPMGSLVGIIGPNGAGKSTFIKAVMGLLPLSGGWVTG